MTAPALIGALMLALTPPWAGDSTDVIPGQVDFAVDSSHSELPSLPGSPASIDQVSHSDPPPPCNTVDVGVECQPVTICYPTELSPTGGYAQTYTGVFIGLQGHGRGEECTPAEADRVTARPSLSALVLRAFRRVPLPEPALSIQPPKGKTLVGLETIFSTKAEPFTRTLTLLGRQITLRIEPTSFLWHHGDGTSHTTDWAGKAWDRDEPEIDGYLTHVYEHTGTVRPSVEVTWSAEFRVGGGAWRPVNGTVTRAAAPVPLQVVEGEPVLNAY